MREFKIGDEVFSNYDGHGEIIEINLDKQYPILVKFNMAERTYTIEGYHHVSANRDKDLDIKHINNEIAMKCTTQAEVFNELARVAKLIEGTDLNLVNMIKYKGEPLSIIGYVVNSKEVDFTFALALVEDKPVFAGDKLWSNFSNKEVVITDLFLSEGREYLNHICTKGIPGDTHVRALTWKQPKKTFLLNGSELPLPTDDNSNVNVEVTYNYVNGGTKTYYPVPRELLKYRWDTMEDRDMVMKAITNLLDGVAN